MKSPLLLRAWKPPGAQFLGKVDPGEVCEGSEPFPTSPELWASRQHPLPPDEIKLRRRNLGDACWSAILSIPDFCARLARIAPRANPLQRSNIYRKNDMAKQYRIRRQYGNRPQFRSMRRGVISIAECVPGGKKCVVAPRLRLAGRMQLMGANRLKGNVSRVARLVRRRRLSRGRAIPFRGPRG